MNMKQILYRLLITISKEIPCIDSLIMYIE
jgi:hypothetical protein